MKYTSSNKETAKLSIRQAVEEAFKRIADRTERRESSSGKSSGSKKIDSLCGRIKPGDLFVYAGYTGQYKTSMIMQIADRLVDEQYPVLWCSSTHTARQLTRRLLAASARIPLARITAAMLSGEHWPDLTRAVGRLADDFPLYFDTGLSADPDLADIRNHIWKHEIKLLVIDSLQAQIGQPTTITSGLKQLAVECNIAIIAVIDLPDPKNGRAKPGFNEVQQYHDIEDDADSLCLLYHETIPDPHGTRPHIECLNITNGAESCRLFFSQEHQELTDTPLREQPLYPH